MHPWSVYNIDDCYQFTRTFGGFFAQCSSKRFLREFTVLLLTTSFHLSPILYCSEHFSALKTLYTLNSFCVPHPLMWHLAFWVPCDPRYLKQFTSFNWSPYSFTYIQPLFTYLEQYHNFPLPIFTPPFFFHSLYQTHLPLCTTSSLSQPLVLCRQQISLVYLKPAIPFPRSSSSLFPSTPAFASLTTPNTYIYIYTLNNHDDITQPCLNPTLTGNYSLTSIPTRTYGLLYAFYMKTPHGFQ